MTDQTIEIGTRHVSGVFQPRMAILLPDSAEKVRQKADQPDSATNLRRTDLDLDVAQWAYDQQKAAGIGTDTLPSSTAY